MPCGRYHGTKPHSIVPSLVYKSVVPSDSSALFPRLGRNSDWAVLKDSGHRVDALERKDPFGLPEYNIPYSLDKRRRWEVEEIAERDIEKLQEPDLRLRVSTAVYGCDRTRYAFGPNPEREIYDIGVKSYHDVKPNGEEVHRKGKSFYNTSLRSLIREPRPPRTRKVRKARPKRWLRDNGREPGKSLPVEEGQMFQKVHVRYSVVEATGPRPSIYNRDEDEGPYGFFWTKKHDRYQHLRTAGEERKRIQSLAFKMLMEQMDGGYSCCEHLLFSEWAAPCGDDVGRETESPTEHADIREFLVEKPGKRQGKRTRKSKPSGDECFRDKARIQIVTVLGSDSEDEEEQPVPSGADIELRAPVESSLQFDLSVFYKAKRLEVSPPTWEVHRVIGGHDICGVISLPACGGVKLFDSGDCPDCPSEAIQWKSRQNSDDFDSLPAPVGEVCGVCSEVMDSCKRPFALACGHFFCTPCWLRLIEQCMRMERLPAPCLDSGCASVLTPSASRANLDGPSHALYRKAVEGAALKKRTAVRCPRCSLFPESGSGGSIACPCGLSICLDCSLPFHAPLPCSAFEQYSEFLQSNGVASMHPAVKGIQHYVSDLLECPECGEPSERDKWCGNGLCRCGLLLCTICGGPWWTEKHEGCARAAKSFVLIDAIGTGSYPSLPRSLLIETLEGRLRFLSLGKELTARLRRLPRETRKAARDTLSKLWQLHERFLLNSRRHRSSVPVRDLLAFILGNFVNTRDGNMPNLIRKIDNLSMKHDSILSSLS